VPKLFGVEVTGQGRPVLFVPGLACSGHVWDGTVAHLGGKVQTHVLTLAGFGGEPAPQPVPPGYLAAVRDEIAAYVRARKLDHPVIVGHSLGGFLVYWLLESEPDLFAGAVVVDGLPFFPAIEDPKVTAAASEPQARAFRDQLAGGAPENFRAGISGFLGSMIRSDAARAGVLADAVKSDQQTTGAAIYEMLTTDLRPELGKIRAPVLIVAAGMNARMLGRARLDALWRAQIDLIPKKELVLVDEAKHFVMLDQPDKFYALVDRALAR
jgi:pimeloyl-ACP methyl ester carboxylesterase